MEPRAAGSCQDGVEKARRGFLLHSRRGGGGRPAAAAEGRVQAALRPPAQAPSTLVLGDTRSPLVRDRARLDVPVAAPRRRRPALMLVARRGLEHRALWRNG